MMARDGQVSWEPWMEGATNGSGVAFPLQYGHVQPTGDSFFCRANGKAVFPFLPFFPRGGSFKKDAAFRGPQ